MPKQLNLFGHGQSRQPEGRGTSDSVEGLQQKWYDISSRRYYKLDSAQGYEGLVEVLMSRILQYSYLDDRPLPYVQYSLDCVEGVMASVSPSFLQRGEHEVALSAWIESSCTLLEIDCSSSLPPDEKVERIVKTISEKASLPGLCRLYGATMLFDALFLNEDRHWSNFSVIAMRDGTYKYAPIFDNGRALKSFRVDDPYLSYLRYEPRPYNADQLECCPRLLGGSRLVIYSSRIDWPAIQKGLLEYYPAIIVDDYLARAQTALRSTEQHPLFNAVEVR